jgi:uncharacterized hydrophobic protein (TIGR00271 family)
VAGPTCAAGAPAQGGYGRPVLHLRLIVPADRTDRTRSLLADNQGVTNLVVLPGAGVEPEGDLVLADVAREAADHLLDELAGLGLTQRGSIAVEGVDLSMSAGADRAEDRAPGESSDAVVWAEMAARAKEESTLSATYLSFFSVAIILAGIAVLLDSSILVIGAMIVGPEFGVLAGVCAGVVLRRWPVVRRSLFALAVGFAVGIVATVLATWLLTALGLIDSGELFQPRPQTGFIYQPDAMSFVVAFLAGIAGMLALTSARSGALVGVLVSVTTIPAAGDASVALAFALSADPSRPRGDYLHQAASSTGQLLLNLAGLALAGALTLLIQRTIRPRVLRRR